jgi:hypothetical protein
MSGLGSNPTSPNDSTSGAGREIFNAQVAQLNSIRMSDARTFMSIVSGVSAGIGGTTGMGGAAVFGVCHVATGMGLMVLCGMDVKSYTGLSSWFR